MWGSPCGLRRVGHDLAIKQQVINLIPFLLGNSNKYTHTRVCILQHCILYEWYIKYLLQQEKRQSGNCYVKAPITIYEESISSVISHKKNWKIITSMHKRIRGFTNMSEASKGINVSHIQRGNLSLDFVSMLPSKTKTPFFNIPKALSFKKLFHLSLYQRLVF